MLTSRDRILTTHVGSLPRNETITELLIKREAGEAIDPKKMSGRTRPRGRRGGEAAEGSRHRHRQ